MAKESDIDRTQIFVPVGSQDAVRAMGAPLRNIATCSAHSNADGQQNMGCTMFDECDREWKGEGRPQNEGYRIIDRNGNVREGCGACFHNVRMALQVEANGGLFDIIGGEGSKYRQRGSFRVHPKRDPDCPQCAKGDCQLVQDMDPDDPNATVPAYPEPSKHPELRKYVRARDARVQVKERDKERRRRQILGPDPVAEEEFEQDAQSSHEAHGSDARGGRKK